MFGSVLNSPIGRVFLLAERLQSVTTWLDQLKAVMVGIQIFPPAFRDTRSTRVGAISRQVLGMHIVAAITQVTIIRAVLAQPPGSGPVRRGLEAFQCLHRRRHGQEVSAQAFRLRFRFPVGPLEQYSATRRRVIFDPDAPGLAGKEEVKGQLLLRPGWSLST